METSRPYLGLEVPRGYMTICFSHGLGIEGLGLDVGPWLLALALKVVSRLLFALANFEVSTTMLTKINQF
jgi:hypothetical protein